MRAKPLSPMSSFLFPSTPNYHENRNYVTVYLVVIRFFYKNKQSRQSSILYFYLVKNTIQTSKVKVRDKESEGAGI